MSQRTAFRIGNQVLVREINLSLIMNRLLQELLQVLCCAPNLRRENVHQRALVCGAFPEIPENEANTAGCDPGAVLLISADGALCNGVST